MVCIRADHERRSYPQKQIASRQFKESQIFLYRTNAFDEAQLHRTRNAGEHRIGARADQLHSAYDECKDDAEHDCVLGNVQAALF